jgi:hypothetical protein
MVRMASAIPPAVMLSMRWWARGVSASPTWYQFQFFWYALEILAEHVKPADAVADRCPACPGELYCRECDKVPDASAVPKASNPRAHPQAREG